MLQRVPGRLVVGAGAAEAGGCLIYGLPNQSALSSESLDLPFIRTALGTLSAIVFHPRRL